MNRDLRRRQVRYARHEKATGSTARTPDTVLGWLTGRRLLIGAVVLALAAAGVFFAMQLRASAPEGVVTTEDEGATHLNLGETYTDYKTNPPTSGPHDGEPAYWGVYWPNQDPFPRREQLVHNMEHGGIIVWYKPSALSPEQLEDLTRTAGEWIRDDRNKVIVYPDESIDSPLIATAWTRMLKLPAYDVEPIEKFIGAFESEAAPPAERNVPLTSPIVMPEGF